MNYGTRASDYSIGQSKQNSWEEIPTNILNPKLRYRVNIYTYKGKGNMYVCILYIYRVVNEVR